MVRLEIEIIVYIHSAGSLLPVFGFVTVTKLVFREILNTTSDKTYTQAQIGASATKIVNASVAVDADAKAKATSSERVDLELFMASLPSIASIALCRTLTCQSIPCHCESRAMIASCFGRWGLIGTQSAEISCSIAFASHPNDVMI